MDESNLLQFLNKEIRQSKKILIQTIKSIKEIEDLEIIEVPGENGDSETGAGTSNAG